MILIAINLAAGSKCAGQGDVSFWYVWHTYFFCVSKLTDFISFCFLLCGACGILVPQPGIKPVPSALEVQNLNHWTAREVPVLFCFLILFLEIRFLASKNQCNKQRENNFSLLIEPSKGIKPKWWCGVLDQSLVRKKNSYGRHLGQFE